MTQQCVTQPSWEVCWMFSSGSDTCPLQSTRWSTHCLIKHTEQRSCATFAASTSRRRSLCSSYWWTLSHRWLITPPSCPWATSGIYETERCTLVVKRRSSLYLDRKQRSVVRTKIMETKTKAVCESGWQSHSPKPCFKISPGSHKSFTLKLCGHSITGSKMFEV